VRSAEIEVRAVDGRESLLREPLVLEHGRPLTVHVEPKTDPAGKPWLVTLDSPDGRHPDRRTTAPDGGTIFNDVLPAKYGLRVGRASDAAWHTEEIDASITS
jgi:hypothetical protein